MDTTATRDGLERTSTRLRELTYGSDSPRITFAEIDAGLGTRALGLSMLIFALPCCLPMLPGMSTACGIVIVILSMHLILGRQQLWLPEKVARCSIERADLRRLVQRVLPTLQRLERFCRPRWPWATGRRGGGILGALSLVLGILLILPIPLLGNLPPGFAAALIGFGLAERDGVVVGIGVLAAAAAITIASTMAWGTIEALRHIF